MTKLTIDDLQIRGKKVLVRVDFNVPIADGRVADDTRITAALPTIRKITDGEGAAILMSHLGRPKGAPDARYSLAPVAVRLGELLGQAVGFAPDCTGDEARSLAHRLRPGDVLLLENLRFHREEEANAPDFALKLAALGDLYVNDAFGSAHRAHASTAAIAALFENPAAGCLMERELEFLGGALSRPARPFVAILGGAKIAGKIDVILNLFAKVDRILIGGGMAFTFLKAQGREVGRSQVEQDRLEMAREILGRSDAEKIVLPVDCVVARSIENPKEPSTVPIDAIPRDRMGLDIGPATVDRFAAALAGAGTILWNGPMGVFEVKEFASGTLNIALAVANATDAGAVSIIGGGDSAAAVAATGTADRMSHISTGGGASLEFLEGKELPGVCALKDRES